MSLSETRLGANVTGLPGHAPLPPLSAAFSRRAALFGAVTVAGVTAAACSPAKGHAAALSANDARLVELADAYEALDRRCAEHTAAHRHIRGAARKAADDAFDALAEGFVAMEEEVASTPADSLAGVLTKARLCQVRTARECADEGLHLSVADDLVRLQAEGALV